MNTKQYQNMLQAFAYLKPIFNNMPISDDEKDLIVAKIDGNDFEFPMDIIDVLKIQWLSHPVYGRALLQFEKLLDLEESNQ